MFDSTLRYSNKLERVQIRPLPAPTPQRFNIAQILHIWDPQPRKVLFLLHSLTLRKQILARTRGTARSALFLQV